MSVCITLPTTLNIDETNRKEASQAFSFYGKKNKETDRTIFLFPENVGPHFFFKKKIKLK